MKQLDNFIIEKLKISSKSKINTNSYNYCPKNKRELQQLIDKLINERGFNGDFNDIDTSKIDDMSELFANSEFNGDISKWDVSNVEDMSFMFFQSKFNQDISEWDVKNVEDMAFMFKNSKFNQDISDWNIIKVKDMDRMFIECPLEKNPPLWYHE